jgi:hypothetical protein
MCSANEFTDEDVAKTLVGMSLDAMKKDGCEEVRHSSSFSSSSTLNRVADNPRNGIRQLRRAITLLVPRFHPREASSSILYEREGCFQARVGC